MLTSKGMTTLCLIIFVLMNNCQRVKSSKILVLLPYMSQSHYSVLRLALIELTKRGHELTVLSTHDEDSHKFQRHVKVTPVYAMEYYPEEERKSYFELLDSIPNLIAFQSLLRYGSARFFCNVTLASPEVQEFIKNDKTAFDLVIAEDFNFNAYYMFAHKYKAPLVTFIASSSMHHISKYMGNPMQMEFVSHEQLGFIGQFTFWQRLSNIWWSSIDIFSRDLTQHRIYHNAEAAKHFKHLPQPLPDLRDIENNISLVLVNSHFSIDTVKSYPPNIIDIGGAHIRPVQKLPADLQAILDNAKDGVIYMSFGSMITSAELPPEKLKIFLKVFSKMNQLVLWKWENGQLPNKSSNVITRKWLPQIDILAHPNVRLFITQGGMLSLQEAIHHSVPILGIPVVSDQHFNVARAKHMGFAEMLNHKIFSEESLEATLYKLVNDIKYKENVNEISRRFRDRPQSALDSAVFWIEYVIRHKGARHLSLPSRDMAWYEYFLLDVIAFALVITAILTALTRKIFQNLFKSQSGVKKDNVQNKQKKS